MAATAVIAALTTEYCCPTETCDGFRGWIAARQDRVVFEHREASIQRGGELGVVEEELLAVGRIAGAEVGQVAVEDRGELGGGRGFVAIVGGMGAICLFVWRWHDPLCPRGL